MVSLLISLGSLLLSGSLTQSLLTLSMCLPLGMCLLYKSTFYVEEGLFMLTSPGLILSLLTLSLLIVILVVSNESQSRYFIVLQVTLTGLLVVCFNVHHLLAFYILFEACLIPILLLIVNWGYQPERLQAGTYMIMYTVLSSLPLLMVIFYFYINMKTYHILSLSHFLVQGHPILLVGLGAFLVKLPVYGLHIWLPKAHVEAPLGGSMILAGVLLKLGGYGLYLYNSLLFLSWTGYLSAIMMVSLCGGVVASIICMVQVDIKALIAYSSVVHMSFIVLGILSNTSWGLYSAIVVMMAHGWVSSALFVLAYVSYQFVGSRSFSYTKGLLVLVPTLSLSWFFFGMVNMGFPPTVNFLGEVLIVPASVFFSAKIFFPVGVVMFMSVVYNMYLYCQINHGPHSNLIKGHGLLITRPALVLLSHALPLLFIVNMSLLIL